MVILSEKWKCLSLSHVWLCDPTDCSLTGSSVHGISPARTLEWVAISFSRGSSQGPGTKPGSSVLQADSLPSEPLGEPVILSNATQCSSMVSCYIFHKAQESWEVYGAAQDLAGAGVCNFSYICSCLYGTLWQHHAALYNLKKKSPISLLLSFLSFSRLSIFSQPPTATRSSKCRSSIPLFWWLISWWLTPVTPQLLPVSFLFW